MARRSFILPVLLILPGIGFAQTLDKEKLRKAAYLPRITLNFGPNVQGCDERGNRLDPAKTIEDLTKRLCGTPEDAEVYFDLVEYHRQNKNEEAAKIALTKMEELLRRHIETNDPKD